MIVEQLGSSKLAQHEHARGARDHREAVRHDARGGARAEPPRARDLRREPGLPHRPLPRQGDRPEHDGVPLRQRHVRAAVEPQLHRQRADHRRRGSRHRHARRLLRRGRRAARPDPEPHAAAALPRRDGATGQLHRRRGAQREGQGAAGDPRSRPPRRSPRCRCARSTRKGHAGGEDVPGYLEEDGVPAGLEHRDLRGAAPGSRQLALGRRALLPAHRQAPGAQGHRDRGDAQAGPPPRLQPGRLARRAAQPARADAAAQRGRLAAPRREDPGHAHDHPPGEHGVPLRHRLPVAVPGGLRAPDHRRDARRRDAVHAQRRGRGAVAHLRPDRRRLGEASPDRCRNTKPARRAPRRPTGCCARATAGARSDDPQRRGLERAGHDARRDRSGAAPAADRASTPKTTATCRRAC